MYKKDAIVKNPSGLHARPASELVAKAKSFQSKIMIHRSGDETHNENAKSIIALLTMGVCQGESVELIAEGPDEQQAVEALTALIEHGFGEI